jgi:hypothetical protein
MTRRSPPRPDIAVELHNALSEHEKFDRAVVDREKIPPR